MIELTPKIKRYQHKIENEFSFTDWDYCTIDYTKKKNGREKRIELERPRYDITMSVKRNELPYKCKAIFIQWCFDDFGNFEKEQIFIEMPKHLMSRWLNKDDAISNWKQKLKNYCLANEYIIIGE